MAEKFIGMTIGVTLLQPPNTVLIGKVTNVILGQTLALQEVFFPATGERLPAWNVAATNIADLQVVNPNVMHHVQPATPHHAPHAPHVSVGHDVSVSPSVRKQAFVDPAILSVGKSPAPASRIAPPPIQHRAPSQPMPPTVSQAAPATASPVNPAPSAPAAPVAPSTPVKAMLAAAAAKLPTNPHTSPFVAHAPQSAKQVLPSAKAPKKQARDFFAENVADEVQEEGEVAQQQLDQHGGKKARRGRKPVIKNTPPVVAAATEAQIVKDPLSPNVSRSGKDMNAAPANNNKKGWRSTPLLKEVGTPDPAKSKKKSKKPQRTQEIQNGQSGWQTEEATDIQDMGDFDFAANLSKFDKRSVFDQIRNEDTTADEDRLVSHNRLARPGTNGGKNLHPTENVLSPQLKPQHDSQELLESTSDADTELNYGSGQNSRRAMSRSSGKRPPRRSNSNMPEEHQHPLSASFASTAFNRSVSSLRNANLHATSSAISTSPNPNRTRSPASIRSPVHALEQLSLEQQQGPHFRIRASGQPCSVFSPHRLRHIEAEAVANIKISADALTEGAARGIADTVLESALRTAPSRRSSKAAPGVVNGHGAHKPVVTILAGNHLAGARAIASARHIYGRGFRVLISVLDFSNPSVWHPQLATQIQSLQALGRKAARIEGWRSTSGHLKRLEGPPAVIVDALLDGQKHSEVQSAEQQAEVRDMIDWANRSRAGVVSVNIPSGFSAMDGTTSVVEGEPLAVRPEAVLALAAPTSGLLEAVKEGEGSQWHVIVVDIGVNVALRDREKVSFGASWTAQLDLSRGEQG
ncbi:hypothetical protein AAFC00_006280 [Neodothiora populina]|uniref:Enhancer of mRNA-decapping protein 3 n=1 Tax=Neodothiora populina TaxID=2781224 RepID=A0ABR3P4Y4_9PEZI